ncbi:MAG: hypothetical protein JJU36_06120 [Phycisphaeraceae bacterium]|nr:hypothetical protein [Phycisphaeraceae bacterium]
MSKETRFNLIVLVVLLAALAPGAVILFNKKLDPDASMMYLPSVLPNAFSYNDPWERPPHIQRIVPELTGQWVRILAEEFMNDPNVREVRWLSGMISQRRGFELVAVGEVEEGWILGLVVWQLKDEPDPESWIITVNGDQVQPRQVVLRRTPREVREELKGLGMVEPHRQARWVDLVLPGAAWDGMSPIEIHFATPDRLDVDQARFRLGRGSNAAS